MPGEMRDTEEEGKSNEAEETRFIMMSRGRRKRRNRRRKRILTNPGKKNVDNNFQNVIFERVSRNIFTHVCVLGSQWVDCVNGETDSPLFNITTLNAFVQFT